MTTNNLFTKILAVSSDVKNIEKNMTVSAGGSGSYKAVADFDVVLAVKKAEAEHKVISIPIKQELVETQILTSTDKYGNPKTQFADIVKMTVRIIDCENPTDFIEVESFGRGLDTGDKGFGKASTYARKYALLNVYKIATGEDPDAEPSPDGDIQLKGKKKAVGAPQMKSGATAPADPIAAVKAAKTRGELNAIWNGNPQLQSDPMFIQACNDQAAKVK